MFVECLKDHSTLILQAIQMFRFYEKLLDTIQNTKKIFWSHKSTSYLPRIIINHTKSTNRMM